MGKKVIAIDIGASGGKMALGEFDGERLSVKEYRDFANRPVEIGAALYWDVFALWNLIIDGMAYFVSKYGEADAVGIDTWGATYGLLDDRGRLTEPVYHYRDVRTKTTLNDMKSVMDPYELFCLTGCQCNRTYTLPQLYSYVVSKNKMLDVADKMLLLPDLLGYFMTGVKTTEMTIAGTSCLLESQQESWSREVAERFSLPGRLYTEIVKAGTVKGRMLESVRKKTGMRNARLMATAGHDSAAAVAAIPNFGENGLYISVGTNISMGVEKNRCLLSREVYEKGFKNTGGICGKKIIYRDFSACWHINEFIRTRREQGVDYTFSEIIELAEKETGTVSWFDVEALEFNEAGGNFCEKMNNFFRNTQQNELRRDGEFIRSIFESIALKVRHYADSLRNLGEKYDEIYIISGAVRNGMLMQTICNALGARVSAGMEYATLAGNILTQLYGLGEIDGIGELRCISGKSFKMKDYVPKEECYWKEAVEKYELLLQ